MTFFNSAGVRIGYVEAGRGDPVVLVHSYTGNLRDQWVRTGVFGALAPSYRVIAFDARGHGESDKPHDPGAYGPEMAWDIARLLDQLGVPRAHVVGYSMGAHIVAQLLALAPQRFVTATLGGACGRFSWTAEDERRAELEAQEMERGLLVTQLTRLSRPGDPPPDLDELRARSAEILAGEDRYALAAVRRANKSQVVAPERIAAAAVPTLGIVGSDDPYRARFDTLVKLMPQLKLVVLERATHVSAPMHPEFIPAILRFLRSHTSASA